MSADMDQMLSEARKQAEDSITRLEQARMHIRALHEMLTALYATLGEITDARRKERREETVARSGNGTSI